MGNWNGASIIGETVLNENIVRAYISFDSECDAKEDGISNEILLCLIEGLSVCDFLG